ncbi:hypothetical protein JRQ81_012479 [Phrynocephalus forsythii]|uniref:DDE Tnp4 domain-containing protein n=1 Tax=Phrynocephalus forsythii TaxID=171643 RepID=A0A9Q0Y270_9SAUR|nr:hypothetical protein JRQ81_012479 [Phrynocephalus forsythii]
MAPQHVRRWWKSLRGKEAVLASVLENVNIILNCISVLQLLMVGEDTDEDTSELIASVNTAAHAVFWAVAEWRVTLPRQKLWWCYPGRSRWFHDSVLQFWDDRQWIENFRMTRQTLFEVADSLRPFLMRRDTVMYSAIPVEERVAIGVYFLASRSCYRTIANVFQKGTSMIVSVIIEVCLAIEHTLLRKEVCVVDFNKFFFRLPATGTDFFPPMLTGHSGVNHDAHVFRSSLLYKKMEAGSLIPGNPMFQYGGVSIPPLLLGDGAYPLCNWLMKPYAVPRNDMERHYNKVFNRTRNTVERAFGRLKARFHRLSVRMEAHKQNVNSIIGSAVILHNICEKKKHNTG